MKKIIFLSTLMCCSYLFSQNKSFIVVDEVNNTPVEYCNVKILKKDKGTYSDSKGLVSININQNDSLIISHILYKEIVISSNSIRDTLRLEQKSQFLDEVTISSDNAYNEWSDKRKEKHQWYIQPKTEFCALLETRKEIQSIRKIRFPIEYLIESKNGIINNSIFRLNIYQNVSNSIGDKMNIGIVINTLKKESNFIEFELNNAIEIPKNGLFLGIEFIGFENQNNEFIENERNNFIKLGFTSTKSSNTYYSNKFINDGKWSLLKKKNDVFPFELKNGLSLIFIYQ